MKHCAIGLKTESGDDYVILCEYIKLEDIAERIYDILDEELAYVYNVIADSGHSAGHDDDIEEVVWNKIKELKNA